MNSAIEALSVIRDTGQRAKETQLRQDIYKILNKANKRGGLFTADDITYLLFRINNIYPGMTAEEQEIEVRRILQKPVRPEREIFAAEVSRRNCH